MDDAADCQGGPAVVTNALIRACAPFTPDAGAELSHSLHDDRGGKPEIVVFTETDRERALDVRA